MPMKLKNKSIIKIASGISLIFFFRIIFPFKRNICQSKCDGLVH